MKELTVYLLVYRAKWVDEMEESHIDFKLCHKRYKVSKEQSYLLKSDMNI